MGQVWCCEASSGQWQPQALVAGRYECSCGPAGSVAWNERRAAGPARLQLRRQARPNGEAWLLLVGRGATVSVNGVRLALAVYQLRDRDEVRVLVRDASVSDPVAGHVFFSAERLAQVAPLPASDKPVICARCDREIAVGSPAVRCPSVACGRWHHQADPLTCWTYRDRCAACDQPTALDTGFRWTPDAL
jgi:hypothetical protein